MAEKGFAEDRMGQKIDRCFSDSVIKAGESIVVRCNKSSRYIRDRLDFHEKYFSSSGVGFTLGGVFSLFFFKRR